MNYFRCPECGEMFYCTGHCGDDKDGCLCKKCNSKGHSRTTRTTSWDDKCFTLPNEKEIVEFT